MDPKSIYLTANDTTVYAFANIDLGKSGPVVVEVPPGQIVGLIDDFWQKSISDIGLPGPDRDKGGKFLLVPPGYSGEIPQSGYHVLQCTMNNYNAMVRGIAVEGDFAVAEQVVRKMKVYPFSQAASPKPSKFVSVSGKVINTLPPPGIEFWARLSAFINNNPVAERDRFYMAMLKPLGIEKGKEFKPDARQRRFSRRRRGWATRWAACCCSMATSASAGATAFPGTHWHWVLLVNPEQETEHYSQVDERLHYTYGAIYTSPGIGVMKAGPGSQYIQAFKDKDGNHLDGGKSYRLHIPAEVPASAFWSLTLYDSAIRSMIQNPSNDSARSSYDKLKINADGSMDLHFAPKAPADGTGTTGSRRFPARAFTP